MSYINMIPSSSLYMLSQWDPTLEVQSFRGSGSMGADAETWEITMGKAKIGKVTTQRTTRADLLYEFTDGEMPIKKVYDSIVENTALPDISLDHIIFMDRDCKMGIKEWSTIRSTYTRRSLHPGIFKRMVVNGEYPLQGIHIFLDEVKNSFNGLPQEIKTRIKPSCMLSEYHPNISEDGPAVYAVKRSYMLFMKTSSKFWELFDMDYKKTGGPSL